MRGGASAVLVRPPLQGRKARLIIGKLLVAGLAGAVQQARIERVAAHI